MDWSSWLTWLQNMNAHPQSLNAASNFGGGEPGGGLPPDVMNNLAQLPNAPTVPPPDVTRPSPTPTMPEGAPPPMFGPNAPSVTQPLGASLSPTIPTPPNPFAVTQGARGGVSNPSPLPAAMPPVGGATPSTGPRPGNLGSSIESAVRGVQMMQPPQPQKVGTPAAPQLRPVEPSQLINTLMSLGVGPQQIAAMMRLGR